MSAPVILQETTQALDVAAQTHTISLPAPPTVGNWILIFAHVRNTSTGDDVQIISPATGTVLINVAAESAVAKLWRYRVTDAQEQTFEIDHDVTGANLVGSFAAIVEVENTLAANPVDVSVTDSDGADVTSLLVGDLVTTVLEDLLLIFVGVRTGGDNDSFSATNGFIVGNARDAHSAAAAPSGGGWGARSVSATGTYNSTFSWTTAGRVIGIGVAISQALEPAERPWPEYGQGRSEIGAPEIYGATIVR